MSTYRNLITLCAAAVFTLGLAACGGGSSGPAMPDLTLDGVQMGETVEAGTHTVSDDLADAFSPADAALLGQEFATDAMVSAGGLDFTCTAGPCSVVLNDNGTVTTTGTIMVAEAMVEPTPPPPANLTALFGAAQGASTDAGTAAKDAMDAETAAKAADDKLTTTQVGGESMTAMMNAQAILDARDDAAQAVTDAEDALADAKKAEMDAMDVADDHPQKAALDAAIAAAIEAAEDAVDDAKAVRDGTALKNAVALVEGTSKKGTPRSIANSVGTDISNALAAGTTRGGTRIAYGATAPVSADVPAALRHVTNDAQGMTWAMIVGEDNVMMMRLGANNAAVQVASIAGMTAATAIPTSGPTAADTIADATSYDNSTNGGNYKSIPGTVWCLGDDCKVGAAGTADAGKLVGSWYFSPDSSTTYYQRQTDDTTTPADESQMYEAETLYATYGHWLTSTGTPLEWTVNTFSSSGGGTDVNLVEGTEANGLDDTVTYSGMAAGMSVRTMGSGDSKTTDSGRFTADVTLTATFGAAASDARVRGTIDKFVGNASGSGWSVNLESMALATTSTDGVATGSGRDGVWSATAYGDDTAARPAGVHGGFTAHFTDGSAAGAFATRLDQ